MKIKTLSGLIALAISTATSAMAADVSLPYKAAPAVPTFSWTGCYLGGNGGGGRGMNEQQPVAGFTFNANHDSGWLAGVQGGCDYQVGSVVVGIEGQFDWADMKDTTASIPPGGPVGFLLTTKLDRMATATARIGYAFDRVLFYAKGGAAFAHFNHTMTQTDFAATSVDFIGSRNVAGFVVGGGIEYALLQNVSLKAEYNYFDFGRNGYTLNCINNSGCANLPMFPVELRQNMQTFMLGVNWRFNTGPVVAKY
ncbi:MULTISPECIES: outer membrane protein [unclassified Bradyrhizobium]|uniref:outer membrane protein n=1 Tax=unclassified Bradyrhizobium TaxID=2631580 RepID=UPI0006875843|nr:MULTISPECIES: outer membrane beta-barrel protein [unclassified Bradyrhizobium]MCP3466699.1 outer membrane beta-barrel protein [Bradyrhizobium sp. CCGUVB23]